MIVQQQLLIKHNFQLTSVPRPRSRPGSARSERSITSTGGQEYHVTVKTGDLKNAGTTARVSLRIGTSHFLKMLLILYALMLIKTI